ncbi:MAG: DUF2933 domain-containing protein [Syntrophomonadaceae bacterium]|nr:DUF2933 domain-containing protein [Syntrophomonadaceae bacterium]
MEKWYFLLILLCPLMHLFMMFGHKHKGQDKTTNTEHESTKAVAK